MKRLIQCVAICGVAFAMSASPAEAKTSHDPKQAWLAMLDGLWNTDKHRVVHIANLTVALEHLSVIRRSDGQPISFTIAGSLGPRGYSDRNVRLGGTPDPAANAGTLARTDR